jgi:hypothetical protein
MIGRRTFIKGASLAALAASTSRINVRESFAAGANSSGSEPAKVKAPPGAATVTTTSTMSPAFRSRQAPGGDRERALRNSPVAKADRYPRAASSCSPAPTSPENVTLDAIAQLKGNSRGVAVVHPAVTDAPE